MQCIDGHNILLGSAFVVVFVLVLLLPSKTSCMPVSQIFEVFFVPHKLNGLILTHHFTKQDRCEHLWMIGKHNLLLHTPRRKCSSTDIFVSEIHFGLSKIFLYRLFVVSYCWQYHWFISILLHNVFNFARLDYSF